ncbi:Uncharacterised protein [Mycobacterium tuberculosis]|nr:Uncharacterised protein [Mycobacterium tuberculosis]
MKSERRRSFLAAKVAVGASVGFASAGSFGAAFEAVSVVVLMESFRALLWSVLSACMRSKRM